MENETHIDPTAETAAGEEFPSIKFEELPEGLKAACERAGWQSLMPVQEKALPQLLADHDVMVQARTGSGKTGAYVLPLIEKLDPARPECQALVMVPTRELAKQVAQDARTIMGDEFGIVAVYGGVAYKEQLDAFRDGAQFVVGTPGRILDHLMRRNLTLDKLRVVIFDEADRMLSVGFYPDMVEVKRYLPKTLDGTYMFSATFPQSVLRLAEEFMVKPAFLSLSSEEGNITAITHQFVQVPAMGKERKLIKLIELENPTSAVIFSNTKRNVEFTAALLSQFGFDAEGLTSDLTQAKREQLMARIKEGKLRFLVATDVAARGIDIPELSHVFMMEPPEDPESYVHRAGRTGRAGASGTAITLVDVIQRIELERIATRFNIHFDEIKDPTDEDVAAIIKERLTALLEKKFRKMTNLERERASRFVELAREYAQHEDSLGLIAMLLDEIYQNTLHGKPAAPVDAPARPQPPRQSSREDRSERPKRNRRSRGRRDDEGVGDDAPRREDASVREARQPERAAEAAREPAAEPEGGDAPRQDGNDESPRPEKRKRPSRSRKRSDRPRPEKPEAAEPAIKPEPAEQPEQAEQSEKPARTEKPELTEKPERTRQPRKPKAQPKAQPEVEEPISRSAALFLDEDVDYGPSEQEEDESLPKPRRRPRRRRR